jgi:hypothetical protein
VPDDNDAVYKYFKCTVRFSLRQLNETRFTDTRHVNAIESKRIDNARIVYSNKKNDKDIISSFCVFLFVFFLGVGWGRGGVRHIDTV